MLRITGPKRGLYWRATTLDQFDSDRWLENPTPLSTGPASGRLPNDPLLPTRSLNRSTWIRQDVEVVALRDTHVVAAAQPVALDAPSLGSVFHLSDGLARAYNGLKRGQRYTVYSYAPRPGPSELARSRPSTRPRSTASSTSAAPASTRSASPAATGSSTASSRTTATSRSGRTRRCGRRRAGCEPTHERRTAPSSRSRPGCARPEASPTTRTPPATGGAPPLAHFVAEGKRGYCQHFAGAMALMLRMLGIPARVAAGFTSGNYEDGGWTVTDHNAHAWVEVWFPGFGWLPFDPTPGRGSLAANYSASSTGFNAGDAADGFVGGATGVNGGGADQLRLLEQKERLAEQAQAGRSAGGEGRSTVWLLVLLALAAVAALGLVKLVRRRSRYLTRDPRRLAGAARRELVDFLADQGIAVSASMTPEELHELVACRAGRRRPAVRPCARGSPVRPAGGQRRRREPCAPGAAEAPAPAPAPARPAGPPARPARAPLAADVIPAVVIAAGLGTRLRPLTERYAKPVLPVDGHAGARAPAPRARRRGRAARHRRDRVTARSRSSSSIGDGSGFGLESPTRARASPTGRHTPSSPPARPRHTSSSAPTRLRARRDRPLRRAPTPARARPGRSPSSRGRGRSRSPTGSSGACSERACSAMPLWAVGPAVASQDRGAARRAAVRALDRVSAGDRRGRGDSGNRGRPDARVDDAVRPRRAQLPLP